MKTNVFKIEEDLPKNLQLKGYNFCNYNYAYDQFFFVKEQENSNYLLASVCYAEEEKVEEIPKRFGRKASTKVTSDIFMREKTRIDYIDTFLYNYLEDYVTNVAKDEDYDVVNYTLTMLNASERAMKMYSNKVDKKVSKFKSIKELLEQGYKVLYSRNNAPTGLKKEKDNTIFVNTIDLVLVKEEEEWFSVRYLYFVKSLDKKEETFIQLRDNTVSIPKSILDKK
jgi:hypothetical protein